MAMAAAPPMPRAPAVAEPVARRVTLPTLPTLVGASGRGQRLSHWPGWPVPGGVRLPTLPDHDCPYLPGREMKSRAFFANNLPPLTYDVLMAAGFRRSGKLIYQPVCTGCRACVPLRIPVDEFQPSKSQRRAVRRNDDLVIDSEPNRATDEKWQIYRRYATLWHGEEGVNRPDFERFLYDSPVHSLDMTYRDGDGTLLAVGVLDVSPLTMSSVYFYFDPAHAKRGLGTVGAVRELDRAAELGLEFYYLGYAVAGCGAMSYKSQFRPHERLCTDGQWRGEAGEAEGTKGLGDRGTEARISRTSPEPSKSSSLSPSVP